MHLCTLTLCLVSIVGLAAAAPVEQPIETWRDDVNLITEQMRYPELTSRPKSDRLPLTTTVILPTAAYGALFLICRWIPSWKRYQLERQNG